MRNVTIQDPYDMRSFSNHFVISMLIQNVRSSQLRSAIYYHYYAGVSAKGMQHSFVKNQRAESSSGSPRTAFKKRKRLFAGSAEIDDVTLNFPFYFIQVFMLLLPMNPLAR